jgi:hypothetical protein
MGRDGGVQFFLYLAYTGLIELTQQGSAPTFVLYLSEVVCALGCSFMPRCIAWIWHA